MIMTLAYFYVIGNIKPKLLSISQMDGFLFYRQGIPIMGKNGKVIQDGTTTNFSLCQRNQPTTLRIRNIADSVHAAERPGSWTVIIVFNQFRYIYIYIYIYI